MSSSTTNNSNSKAMTGKKENKSEKSKQIEIVFNEDDAFEEFEMDTWKVDSTSQAQNEDADLWTDDWGDKDVDEAFEELLRKEMQNASKK
eukprot:CAMPEP_0202694918 /NCGR_PEP_ID=MMETSP1385-20130828/8647_1 /ASSEMBLY_ACC=CAM_ASM_000861 /TAXON_ID=933848 /ORGANISM="Elphidium margaritaceum" /LENGTH=89 /DNA_ID=CAMNT_0049350853 /DNA_START=39 /DNA_END=308 /DNA_ORIENTATION=-